MRAGPPTTVVPAARAIRVALIGYGSAGSILHAPLIASTAGLELGAVVTSDPARRRAVRAAYPGTEVLASVDDVWEAGFDLVVVATSNDAHATLADRAITADLAVIVDKPLATTSAAADRVVALARERSVPLSVFQNRRWDGDFRTVERVLSDGRLGRTLRYEARFETYRPLVSGAWSEEPDPSAGGGVLIDLGSHLIDQAVRLFGAPLSVGCHLGRGRPGTRVEDDALVTITFTKDITAHLWLSWTAHASGPGYRVLGSDAAFEIDGTDPQWGALARGERPGRRGWGRYPAMGRVLREHGPGPVVTYVRPMAGAYQRLYEGVRDALRTGAPMPVDPRDAVTVLRVIEAARASAQLGRVVDLEDPAGS